MLVAAAIAFACLLVGPSFAAAEQFVVNSAADETDAAVGNEFCETALGACTLRAAIEEANAAENEDEVRFDEGLFKGDTGSVVDLQAGLPVIVHPLALAGGRCDTQVGVRGPCVQIDGVAGAPTLAVEEAEGVDVQGLALTGSQAGVIAKAAPRLKVRGDWVGVGLDGTAAANGTGVEVGPGSDQSQIGREDPEAHNIIANSVGTGLAIVGSSGVKVLGNEFGIEPDVDQPSPNGADIVIESTAGEADAVGNVVGTRAGPPAAASPVCELGCNLVSGSESDGIDLSGAGAGDPPIGTSIVGNHIGLDRAGTGSIPNAGAGILVGTAQETVIGGPRGGDANLIAGGSSAVSAGPGAPYLVVQRNLIGTRAAATAPPQEGIVVDSQGFSFLEEEALIVENEIGLTGGTGISQNGPGATILLNRVSGATTGIRLHGEGAENLVERNSIAAGDTGILIENSFNDVVGNEVVGAGRTGISVQETPPATTVGNVIGGDTDAEENAIFGSGNAIEIATVDDSLNEVARNHGSGNSGLFIDLIASAFGAGSPNHGIAPPEIVKISETGVAGFAESDARVRLFRKATASPGEVAAFLGQATADKDGNWSFTFPGSLPVGSAIAATQTKEEGTSELEIATVPLPAEREQPAAASAPLDRKPPRTRMLKQARRVAKGQAARFAFTSNEAGSSFQCSLDGAGFRACKSPKRYRHLRAGKHLFRVRAIDAAGNVDPTPVRRRFEVLG